MQVTHEVFNQVVPWHDTNVFEANAPMRQALKHLAPGIDVASLVQLGSQVASVDMQQHAALANTATPQLKQFSPTGTRIDTVDFHPSYHALMQASAQAGLQATPWSHTNHPHAHLQRGAGFMLFTELEPSVLCPMSMSYAAWPALQGNAAIAKVWGPKLQSPQYDRRDLPFAKKTGLTMGMGMTEKQGGSDVRANTTQAKSVGHDEWGERFEVVGHKWFFSAPMSDAWLVLAQTPEGMTCLFMPRWLPDGTRNAIAVQRLKDKLGNKANASSEVEFAGATAWRVGEAGRGIAQILDMGMVTRLDCSLGTAGLMRGALSIALNHVRQRHAFGKPVIEHALMRRVLADMALESHAATALALRLAASFDKVGDPTEDLLRRVLTPVAKFWICKRGSHFAQEAMECLGGNGYVEEGGQGVMARIYREMPLNSIWEGAGNIMALDLLRALRKGDVTSALHAECIKAKGHHQALDKAIAALPTRLELLSDEVSARRLAQDLALTLQASLLVQTADTAVADAFCETRLSGSWGAAFGSFDAHIDETAVLQSTGLLNRLETHNA